MHTTQITQSSWNKFNSLAEMPKTTVILTKLSQETADKHTQQSTLSLSLPVTTAMRYTYTFLPRIVCRWTEA